ncbi:glycerophosphoryl diester phosphodiesterase [Telluribacter sp.]|uniref:glycerophosphoryl diester phosphodiesterase n=1 Tax=Telluribacter sp. TaxID=1978767 RepID=UPI002E0DDDE7|nr:glycerophosphoryl diester phosphodiesterase [Telluribacter sp.]
MHKLRTVFLMALLGVVSLATQAQTTLRLNNSHLQVEWKASPQGWQIQRVAVLKGEKWNNDFTPSGEYTLIYSEEKPSGEAARGFEKSTGGKFPEDNYHLQQEQWKESTTAVALNTAGKAYHFFPSSGKQLGKNHIRFVSETDVATLTTDWKLDEKYPTDVLVTQTLTPKKKGYFSAASPSVATLPDQKMGWASVPGYFQGNYLQDNFAKAYAYGFGVPKLPVIYRERTASTLAPLLSTQSEVTMTVIPEPGLARDPWEKNKITQTKWQVGLSHRNRKGQLSPTLYYPVLGEYESGREAGQELSYNYRYSLVDGDWFKTLKHAIYDIYKFKEGLELRQSKQSLTSRIEQMHHYLTDPQTSLWNIEEFEGLKIGAQSYLGAVVGSQKDAMKNSDYGAMWMLAHTTQDPDLTQNVIPYALNFKLTQQQTEPGFFQGAAIGQYYLAKRKKFVEEWGEIVEPMAVTYYIMLDVGNMLLFEPENKELKERLRLGAENLLRWQKPDGSWAVAYDHKSLNELFQDVADYRPTFYGLLVAYRMLKDPKYLEAAKKGADWFVKNGVNRGSFLGVCGDARYAPDFATGQSAQALLDLYDITKNETYKDAAIKAAKIYTSSVYTHPIPDREIKNVNGIQREDWEIAQAGLSFEHGGIFGSANRTGPIQLASHAGLFIRMYELTGETLFADMARAAAIGRDAFVDHKTSVASYYWNAMNRGAGPFPHHAWWQIGWITDYLLSEAELRSKGKVSFPRGFITPKVGPHQTYGFAPGTVNGEKARLVISEDWVKINNPSVDYILAEAVDSNKRFVILLNNRAQPTEFNITMAQRSPVKKQLPAWGMEVVNFE